MTTNRMLRTACVAVVVLLTAALAWAEPDPGHLASRPRPGTVALPALAVGGEVQTAAGQRRTARLPDGSILYVNQNSTVKLEADRALALAAGEVFVEVAPRKAEGLAFVVKTPKR